jgi:ubiquinone/menaquinone biosynthesis C-methylase UbiE
VNRHEVKENWHDPDYARSWDETANVGNPTRIEQLDIVLSMIQAVYRTGGAILDLGAGSGQLEERLLARVPDAQVVAVDSSRAMLDIARTRLNGTDNRLTFVTGDLGDPESIVVPPRSYQVAVSVQALHHVPDTGKQRLFAWLHRQLEPNGLFVLMDRFAIPLDGLRTVYGAVWDRLERTATHKSGWTAEHFLGRFGNRQDNLATVADHLAMLRGAGFAATCVHLHLERAVLAAVKGT